MKHFKLFALLVLGVSLAGCTSTSRYVTNQTWVTDDAFLMSYAEYTASFFTSETEIHTELCTLKPDNAVVCEKQPHIDKLLNPHLAEKYSSVTQPKLPVAAPAPAPQPEVVPEPEATPEPEVVPETKKTKKKAK